MRGRGKNEELEAKKECEKSNKRQRLLHNKNRQQKRHQRWFALRCDLVRKRRIVKKAGCVVLYVR